MKKFLLLSLMLLVLTGCNDPSESPVDHDGINPPVEDPTHDRIIPPSDGDLVIKKPVIYLYGYNEKVNVQLEFDENTYLSCSYPEYKEDGWTVRTKPDGRLQDRDGRIYRYLYWEADTKNEWDMSEGFCVRGEYTADFLEFKLNKLGLTDEEADDFITYWLPQMEDNKYNVVSFQTDIYENAAGLKVDPRPDTMIRVFMAWYPSEEKVDIKTQNIKTPERAGKTVVEWGGSKIPVSEALEDDDRDLEDCKDRSHEEKQGVFWDYRNKLCEEKQGAFGDYRDKFPDAIKQHKNTHKKHKTDKEKNK